MNDLTERPAYPSDLTDEQWSRIAPLLPASKNAGRRRGTDLREVLNAINYRWRTGCVWRMLPHDFPPWATVYTYFRAWQRDGTLKHVREVLLKPHRKTRDGLRSQVRSTGRPVAIDSCRNRREPTAAGTGRNAG